MTLEERMTLRVGDIVRINGNEHTVVKYNNFEYGEFDWVWVFFDGNGLSHGWRTESAELVRRHSDSLKEFIDLIHKEVSNVTRRNV